MANHWLTSANLLDPPAKQEILAFSLDGELQWGTDLLVPPAHDTAIALYLICTVQGILTLPLAEISCPPQGSGTAYA